jgi:hypothetical protein
MPSLACFFVCVSLSTLPHLNPAPQSPPAAVPPQTFLSLPMSLQQRVKLAGSCTALVAVLRPNGMLDVQLVGDCGLRVIRDGEVLLATEVRGQGLCFVLCALQGPKTQFSRPCWHGVLMCSWWGTVAWGSYGMGGCCWLRGEGALSAIKGDR